MENEIEKRVAQLRHRKEETEARDRVKERKQRTRRLIIEGALLESCCPELKTMCIPCTKATLLAKVQQGRFRGCTTCHWQLVGYDGDNEADADNVLHGI